MRFPLAAPAACVTLLVTTCPNTANPPLPGRHRSSCRCSRRRPRSCGSARPCNEWRYYRMEVWPDLFGRALAGPGNGAVSAPKAAAGSTRIPIPARRSTLLPTFSGPSAAAATRTAPGDGAKPAAGTRRQRGGSSHRSQARPAGAPPKRIRVRSPDRRPGRAAPRPPPLPRRPACNCIPPTGSANI